MAKRGRDEPENTEEKRAKQLRRASVWEGKDEQRDGAPRLAKKEKTESDVRKGKARQRRRGGDGEKKNLSGTSEAQTKNNQHVLW